MNRCFQVLMTAVVFMAFACGTLRYSNVYSYEDEFRGSDKRYTRLRIKSDERRTEIGSARVILERETGGEGEVVKVYFVINRSSSSFKAGNTGFLKAGDKRYELFLEDPVSELKEKSEATISGIATVDSSGFVSGQTAGIDTRTWIEEKFVVNLSKEAIMAISEAEDVLFRFYFGPIPATYKLRGRRLEAVRSVVRGS